jgi:hypothetical protein
VSESGAVDPAAPDETWNLEVGPENIGHAVTAVGYVAGTVNYVIVHDNWPTTPQIIALPWANWVVSMAMNPPAVSVSVADALVRINHFYLAQNYPNPFNPITIINYQLPITSDVELSVYNPLGQKVTTLVSEKQIAGYHQVEWDASGLASGIYYYRLHAGDFVQVRKMVLLR